MTVDLVSSFRALGTTAVIGVADPARLVEATEVVRRCTERIDAAASRFRDDSELVRLHAASAGRPAAVSDTLLAAIEDALVAARFTGGVVDPTVGRAMEDLGYDRDFGDVAVAGAAPDGGWAIRIADRHDAAASEPSVTVAISRGGLATSGVAARRWSRGDRHLHHLVDPGTGRPAETCWRTVSVTARTCVRANTASTAAVVMGDGAPDWLARHGFCARLVTLDGTVVGVGGWPADALDPRSTGAHDPRRAGAPDPSPADRTAVAR
jgi:thiamine biosynthesis lipoprotein ApbE